MNQKLRVKRLEIVSNHNHRRVEMIVRNIVKLGPDGPVETGKSIVCMIGSRDRIPEPIAEADREHRQLPTETAERTIAFEIENALEVASL